MMRIKSSTSGGWAEEGPLVVKRRKSERHQENRERRQGIGFLEGAMEP